MVETSSCGIGHTPRHSRAHRTGHQPVPQDTVRWMLPIGDCCQSPIPSRDLRSQPVPGIRTQRKAPGCCLPTSVVSDAAATCTAVRMTRPRWPCYSRNDAQTARVEHDRMPRKTPKITRKTDSLRLRTHKTKSPRIWSEGIRVPRRSGRPISAMTKDQSIRQPPANMPSASRAHWRASLLRYVGRASAMWLRDTFTRKNPRSKDSPLWRGRGHYADTANYASTFSKFLWPSLIWSEKLPHRRRIGHRCLWLRWPDISKEKDLASESECQQERPGNDEAPRSR